MHHVSPSAELHESMHVAWVCACRMASYAEYSDCPCLSKQIIRMIPNINKRCSQHNQYLKYVGGYLVENGTAQRSTNVSGLYICAVYFNAYEGQ